jgi:hypothetical protein
MIRNFGSHTTLDRRRFIQAATGVLTGVLSALSPLAALVPARAWAVEMRTLSSSQAATLLAVIRTMLPHDGLDEAAYALVVGALDAQAASSPELRQQLEAGIAALGPDFTAAPEASRVAALRAIESGEFFKSVRRTSLLVLYDNPIAWAHFGYEGEAFSKGGYLFRGFNDLKWLPEVPLEASGPMPVV